MTPVAHAILQLPTPVCSILGLTARTHGVEGATVEEALEDAYRRLPGLRVHLCDESGSLRRHVSCYLNETGIQWLSEDEQRLADGDRITILQAVSGGSAGPGQDPASAKMDKV